MGGVDGLTLEIRGVDIVIVDDVDGADTCRSEVHDHRRPEAPCADHRDCCVEQSPLARNADLNFSILLASSRSAVPRSNRASDQMQELIQLVTQEIAK